ncbi:hypothetical protein [Pseudonocardia xinjiangensis]|uniref:Uncharacterized protein n=1 Tax=Pseudonocardia xinjiangensis TaxID=75289 RepID=A0ABX1RC65_9PSEU|nr:hypothetical protein [Pseudonocardia xinjiangensis]NMH77968.1 hypothetical protein [Pseudonocardia xinjiangensis]
MHTRSREQDMWLVTGIDEEHRFPRWTEAVEFYRQVVGDWVADHDDPGGDAAQELTRSLDALAVGEAHEVAFPSAAGGDGAPVRFGLTWEVAQVGMDHFTAC